MLVFIDFPYQLDWIEEDIKKKQIQKIIDEKERQQTSYWGRMWGNKQKLSETMIRYGHLCRFFLSNLVSFYRFRLARPQTLYQTPIIFKEIFIQI